MNNKIAVKFSNVTKEYNLCKNSKNSIISLIFNRKNIKKKKVLNNISFSISKGETVAILGKNGMGKSTILKLLTGTSYPTSGQIIINGNVSSILELNAGFDPTFTGRENIYFKCQVLGLKKKNVDMIINNIIEFADIGEYIDQPVQTYSSGMKSRLGFAIVAFLNPDILAVDEVLSVGDFAFQKKCEKKIKEFTTSHENTFILVTHQSDTARKFCKRGLLIKDGKIIFDGNINECIKMHLATK